METEEQLAPQRKGRLISRVLTPAIKLWLRSQLDHIDDLQLQIDSGNRELLSGSIPKVFLSAAQAVYQGIHLSRAQVIAENISTNLRQVLRGKAIRLLEPLPIQLDAALTATDLAASTDSELFQTAMKLGLVPLIEQQLSGVSDWPFPDWQPGATPEIQLSDLRMELSCDRLQIYAQVQHPVTQSLQAIVLETGLLLVNPHELRLDSPQGFYPPANQPVPLTQLHDFGFDLGTDVQLTVLQITEAAILCQGQIKIMPVQPGESDLD
ncbi:DUF2993 domain-containing protein [Acaryochloris sp. CCMEE 5410]|uniref:LmeA family phospholipid-binding protein n=1 Tax=Acaryochloris sp. CCMEE 5410 TaxID=310037 RepID=UPI0002483974|nr:DUF2993 domain-containing protein [Acaryochloris sp. CCMEE 5410]KAI9131199.1 DUF2993 domain-containing protein [Acaryochloris sp. CCMEE 5410]